MLERVWLTLVREGLTVSFFNILLGIPDLRLQLRSLLGLSTWPQLLLRVGYSLTESVQSPRRTVQEILAAPCTTLT